MLRGGREKVLRRAGRKGKEGGLWGLVVVDRLPNVVMFFFFVFEERCFALFLFQHLYLRGSV